MLIGFMILSKTIMLWIVTPSIILLGITVLGDACGVTMNCSGLY